MKLSKIDNLILSNLLNNCRESDRQIGQKIGLSGVAVRSRIEKMLKSKLIEKFTLKIEPHLLGYNVIYLVTTGQDVNEIVKQVKLVGEPFFVVPCVGGYSACGIVVKGEVEQKIAIMKNLSQQNEKKTIIMVEQNAKKGLEFADIGYVLVSGQTAIAGKGDDLLNNPDVGRLFLGG